MVYVTFCVTIGHLCWLISAMFYLATVNISLKKVRRNTAIWRVLRVLTGVTRKLCIFNRNLYMYQLNVTRANIFRNNKQTRLTVLLPRQPGSSDTRSVDNTHTTHCLHFYHHKHHDSSWKWTATNNSRLTVNWYMNRAERWNGRHEPATIRQTNI